VSYRIGLACDHAGKELKKLVQEMLSLEGHDVTDYGVAMDKVGSVDYPDFAASLAEALSQGRIDKGIAICGTGIGMAIVANKFPGVRAAVVWDEFSAKLAKEHNDVNILCLGARTTNLWRATELVKIWLSTNFEGSRHKMRLEKISELEKKILGAKG
jgi:ribose 5-phosphate isomerase B